MSTTTISPPTGIEKTETVPIVFPKTKPVLDQHRTMQAVEWRGRKSVSVTTRPAPDITEDTDAIIRITTAAICGSDLHLYNNEFQGMESGDVLGHEGVGIVEKVGPAVKTLKPGDRVVVSAVIACGQCYYCNNHFYSCCDRTNPSKEMEEAYGHRTSGLFGYSHLTGGYDGLQAEYARVPLADINCLKVTDSKLSDEKLIMLSDILCTAWHANELAQVSENQTVAIWGCGPVGLLTIAVAKYRGARKIIAIDVLPYRLEKAKLMGATHVINASKEDVLSTIKKLAIDGPDACIDAAGFRFPKELKHKLMRMVRLETDSPDILRECIMSVRKAGRVAVIGDYYMLANNFPIGAFMEKGLTMAGGQVFVQKYWRQLLELLEQGKIDPTPIITHVLPLERASVGYEIFNKHQDNAIKVLLRPPSQATPS